MIAGSYTLDLCCDVEGCNRGKVGSFSVPDQYTGASREDCTRQAERNGWLVIHATSLSEGNATCPECRARLKSFVPRA